METGAEESPPAVFLELPPPAPVFLSLLELPLPPPVFLAMPAEEDSRDATA